MFFKELVHQTPGKLTNFNLAEKTLMTQSISLKWKESCIKTYLYVFSQFLHFTDVFPNPAQLFFFFVTARDENTIAFLFPWDNPI